ncbi:helix-turn-helix domain-containing protein [Micromonospora robiginosa]|uniref:Helix-turn-helix transcriptional regulator n=1 Tax=Micromonospora robiginosa TaxID=2749844 RepID=A0A7L6BET1_9ACTN|nr:helix-turn-helix transcriptional regulator [Micromonospora ferruginea]QLQ40305.1 helix-turn-helix transcriptional regulator [Micromonospora ferruginea]
MANEVLRVAMAEKGETSESLAAKVRVDPKTAARWLAAGRIPHPQTRVAVAEVLGRAVAELWPEPFRRRDLPWFRPWVELEQDATSFRWYEPLLVPGLLQTEGYAHAVLSTGALFAPAVVDEIVAGRIARQRVLDRDDPPQLVAVIDEVVLRRPVGDRSVMVGQLGHLAAVAGREHVQVRVIPADGPWHTGLAGPFVLGRLPDGTELAYLDNQLRGQVVTDPVDVASLGRRWESVTGEALTQRRSIELIRGVAETWT